MFKRTSIQRRATDHMINRFLAWFGPDHPGNASHVALLMGFRFKVSDGVGENDGMNLCK